MVLGKCSLVDDLAGDCWAAGVYRGVLGVVCRSKGAAHLVHHPLQPGLPVVCRERDASPSPLVFCPPGAPLQPYPLPKSAGRNV